ncbi:MAG: phosphatidylglycerol lysyltransferase domain-containing protein [Paludibacter sp.]|nr:phosphatidylglycerol lysyltransferase domain-containing protein [Paludibacter sp.]
MLNFQKIEITDKKLIDNCLQSKQSRSCDYCFTNLYAWQERFKTVFAVFANTLFVKFEEKNTTFYMYPVGKMPLKKALELLENDAIESSIDLKIKAVSPEMWQQIQEEIPNKFSFLPERENFEYLYLTEKLIALSGKKLQSKRNHINRFKAENPSWEFTLINTREDCFQCWNMLKEWESENMQTDPSLIYDFKASELMLKHFDALALQGGMIKINGQIVSFAVGEPLDNDTFVVHIEKAPRNMNGGYAIINQQFAEHIAANYLYINREEDMGLESLRKAKLSYQPEMLLQEGVVILK